MGLQIAIGRDGDVDLWCVDRGFTPEGGLKFWVINGHWAGTYRNGRVTIGYDDDDNEAGAPRGTHYPGKLLWRGRTPFRDEDYNEAMSWLRSYLKKQPELKQYFEKMEYGMTTKTKINFTDALQSIDADRHNERVAALATAHAEMQTRIVKQEERLAAMKAYQVSLAEKGEDIENLSEAEFSELYNQQYLFG